MSMTIQEKTGRSPAPTRVPEAEALGAGATAKVGYWAGLLTAVWSIWFAAAFAPWIASMPEWRGISALAGWFEPLPYVAWVIPCLLLALTFPVLMVSIHLRAPSDRRIWSLTALAFGGMYGAILSANYWLLATVVREALEAGATDGLSWFVIGSPHTITGGLEGIGYGFMGLAALFGGLAFGDKGLEGWIRRLFVINGLSGLAGVIVLGMGDALPASFGFVGWLSLAAWNLTFPVATVLAAVLFRRTRQQVQQAGSLIEGN